MKTCVGLEGRGVSAGVSLSDNATHAPGTAALSEGAQVDECSGVTKEERDSQKSRPAVRAPHHISSHPGEHSQHAKKLRKAARGVT